MRVGQMNPENQETLKHIGDAVSAGVVIGALASWLPPVAALLAIVWTIIRIYETQTIQRLLGRE